MSATNGRHESELGARITRLEFDNLSMTRDMTDLVVAAQQVLAHVTDATRRLGSIEAKLDALLALEE